MADANRILAMLVMRNTPATVTALMATCKIRRGESRAVSKSRSAIIQNLARLMKRGLVKQQRRRSTAIGEPEQEALYSATKAGIGFSCAGKKVDGPVRQRSYPRAYASASFYQRLWKALRLSPGKRGSLPELIALCRQDGDPATEQLVDNARHYLLKLAKAGIVTRMSAREKGSAPTSNGFVRFALPRDLGPLAPVTRKGFVFDPNSRTQIEYRAASSSEAVGQQKKEAA